MILSPKHNFLLIKNYKVGGTSLEIELSETINDPEAIITKIYPDNVNHKPRNYDGFYNHMSYLELSKKLGLDYLNTINSAVFVRNPFDIVLSHLYMSAKWSGVREVTDRVIDDYFAGQLILKRLTGKKSRSLYTIEGQLATKHVLRYEDGLDSINPLLIACGISPIKGVYREKTYKSAEIKASNTFNQRHVDIINEDWEWEFKTFNYSNNLSVIDKIEN